MPARVLDGEAILVAVDPEAAETGRQLHEVRDGEVVVERGRRLEGLIVGRTERLVDPRRVQHAGLRREVGLIRGRLVVPAREDDAHLRCEGRLALRVDPLLVEDDVLVGQSIDEPLALGADVVAAKLGAVHQARVQQGRHRVVPLDLRGVQPSLGREVGEPCDRVVADRGRRRRPGARVPVDRVCLARQRLRRIGVGVPARRRPLELGVSVLPVDELVAPHVGLPHAVRLAPAGVELESAVPAIVHQRALGAHHVGLPVHRPAKSLLPHVAGVSKLVLEIVGREVLAADLVPERAARGDPRVACLEVHEAARSSGHLERGPLELLRILGLEREHAVGRVRAVQCRPRPHQHLDPRKVDLRDGREAADGQTVLGKHGDAPIFHHQHAVVERRVEAAGVDRHRRDPDLDEVDPFYFLECRRKRVADRVGDLRRLQAGDGRGSVRDLLHPSRRRHHHAAQPQRCRRERHVHLGRRTSGHHHVRRLHRPVPDPLRPKGIGPRRDAGDREATVHVADRTIARPHHGDARIVERAIRRIRHRSGDAPALRLRQQWRDGEDAQHGQLPRQSQ